MRFLRSSFVKPAALISGLILALFAGAASAHNAWSVGISAPGSAIGFVEPAPAYYPAYSAAPAYVAPSPRYYEPAPVYQRTLPPVFVPGYAPAPVYYQTESRYGREDWEARRWERRQWRERREEARRYGWDRD
jgi:hypothetical protein